MLSVPEHQQLLQLLSCAAVVPHGSEQMCCPFDLFSNTFPPNSVIEREQLRRQQQQQLIRLDSEFVGKRFLEEKLLKLHGFNKSNKNTTKFEETVLEK